MRDIKIVLPKSTYFSGEIIRGFVAVRADKDFECNRIVVTFTGEVKTRITTGSGKHRHTHRETIPIVKTGVIVHEGGLVYAGESRFEFEFQIPPNAPPSYDTYHGDIYYRLDAKIEVSWALDPKDSLLVNVVYPYRKEVGRGVRVACENNGSQYPPLEVQLDNTSFCMGELVPFNVRISSGQKIRKVRFELIHHEYVRARSRTRERDHVLAKSSIDAEEIQYDTWFAIGVEIPRGAPPAFDAQIIKSYLYLKVTLDIPWRFDKSVVVNLVHGYCIDASGQPH